MRKPKAALQPKTTLTPRTSIPRGERFELRGRGFLDCAVRFEIDGRPAKDIRIARGFPLPNGLRPHGDGGFVAFVGTLGLQPGQHEISVHSRFRGEDIRLSHRARIVARKEEEKGEGKPNAFDLGEQPFARSVELHRRRFGALGYIPQGVLAARAASLRRARDGVHAYSKIITPGCNWTALGPSPVISASQPTFLPLSGKVRSLAIDPNDGQTAYVGGAVGGVWKTTDGGDTWRPMSDYQSSLAIGALAIDPHDSSHVYAGTGVYPDSGYLDFFGNGLLESTDEGATWIEQASATFQRQAISQIRFDPIDPTSQHMFLSATNGVYESTDGGVNWTQLYAGDSGGLAVLVSGGHLELVAAVARHGLYTSSFMSGAWQPWTQIVSAAFSPTPGYVVIGQSRGTPGTMYAAFESWSGGDDLGGIARSVDGGVTWTACNKPPSTSSQLWHAFHLAVHPTDTQTVYYGEVVLWKSTDGGQSWTGALNGIYADQNAFAFDPVDPEIVWAGNDGGVWRSSNGAASWESRNAGLALTKCIQLAQHPTWDAVLLATSQDDGAYRYQGQAGWELVGGGDTGPAGIDPTTPTTMYLGGHGIGLWRSDTAGAPWSYNDKTGAMSGSSLFYAPFLIDPNDASVCYFGADALWRSANRGDAWTAVTPVLDSAIDPIIGNHYAISGIAVQSGNPDRAFVCSSHGMVYSVERTGADWTQPNVTVTDITGAGLPAGASLSDIVIDSAGTLWVTVSSILIPLSENQFTSDHVYRLTSGSTVWESRSNGLAVANPANTIVIDPQSDQILYCGCDSGVFQTIDAGMSWTPWDDGLPNAPVFDLVLNDTQRLLRAATFGRSVWERPLDTSVSAAVDLYLRDNLVDTGRQQPSPMNVPDPFQPANLDWFWMSEDIKVDGPAPDYQTTNPIADYVSFEQVLVHTSPRRGEVNRFYVQIQNRGPLPATGVQVRAFFADAHAGLPPLPSDFWLNGSPFTADPSASTYVPVGPMRTIPAIYPGQPAVVEWDWTVPLTAPDHSCLLVFATCNENVLNGSGSLDPNWLVPNDKQITLKNLHVEDAVPGTPQTHTMMLRLHNPLEKDARFDVGIHWGTTPVEAALDVAFEWRRDGHVVTATAAELKRGGVSVVTKRGIFPASVEDHCGDAIRIDRSRIYSAEREKRAAVVIPRVRVSAERSLVMLLRLTVPEGVSKESFRFDVVQRSGKAVVGGSSYEIRPVAVTASRRVARGRSRGR